MWLYVEAIIAHRRISWRLSEWKSCPDHKADEGVRIEFKFIDYTEQFQRRSLLNDVTDLIEQNRVEWIVPRPGKWLIDLDGLQELVKSRPDSLPDGRVELEPEVETGTEFGPGLRDITHWGHVHFYLTEDMRIMEQNSSVPPVEISESLERFRRDHPYAEATAFLMMQFGQTSAHKKIVEAIRDILKQHSIKGVRADDKEYHPDLFPNVQTYLHGCGFGIALFERIEGDEFNPNVALEVGYMMAMRKPVCLLKDKTLKALHTDMIGKLYRPFDTQHPAETIPAQLEKWLADKGLAEQLDMPDPI